MDEEDGRERNEECIHYEFYVMIWWLMMFTILDVIWIWVTLITFVIRFCHIIIVIYQKKMMYPLRTSHIDLMRFITLNMIWTWITLIVLLLGIYPHSIIHQNMHPLPHDLNQWCLINFILMNFPLNPNPITLSFLDYQYNLVGPINIYRIKERI